ncbi:unnamed protein product [Colias eurytheme]|nr:unnamed protein product [Colias eurytheme]
MKVFVGLFACLVAVQAQPLFGLDSLTGGGSNPTSDLTSVLGSGSNPTSDLTSVLGSGSNPTSAVKSLGSGLSGGLPVPAGLPDLSSIFSNVFSGSDGAAAFPKVLAALKIALGKANPNGDVPIDTFKSFFNDAAKNDDGFPFNFLNNILGNIPGLSGVGGAGGADGADNGLSVFLNLFIKLFSSNGTIPASVTSKLSDLFSQGDITPEQLTSTLESCASGLNAEQSNSNSHSDSLDYNHNESTSLSKKSADESNANSAINF